VIEESGKVIMHFQTTTTACTDCDGAIWRYGNMAIAKMGNNVGACVRVAVSTWYGTYRGTWYIPLVGLASRRAIAYGMAEQLLAHVYVRTYVPVRTDVHTLWFSVHMNVYPISNHKVVT
jgi:hypothetical protein